MGVLVALLVAVLAVRALGETDLNPVSGVGKLSQVCSRSRTSMLLLYLASRLLNEPAAPVKFEAYDVDRSA